MYINPKRIVCKYCYIAWYDFSGPSFDAESIARESRKLREAARALELTLTNGR